MISKDFHALIFVGEVNVSLLNTADVQDQLMACYQAELINYLLQFPTDVSKQIDCVKVEQFWKYLVIHDCSLFRIYKQMFFICTLIKQCLYNRKKLYDTK